MTDQTGSPPQEELVPVMVPRPLLMEVYAFMASHKSSNGETPAAQPLHRGWNAELIIEAYRAASPRMQALLDLLASRPDERLYVEDFMEELGVNKQDFVNGVLGAFGRLTSQQFASRLPGEHTWPFSVGTDIRQDRSFYEMPASVADVIKSIDH